MNFDFSGKTVLITAGSKGIGFALANNFAKCNANVVICSRDNKNLKIAKKKILSENKKAKILALKFDISKTDEIDNLLQNSYNQPLLLSLLLTTPANHRLYLSS